MRRAALVLATAIGFDLAFGEPSPAVHPVVWLGTCVRCATKRVPRGSDTRDFASGIALASFFPGVAFLGMFVARRFLGRGNVLVGIAGEAILLKQCFAVRSLFEHVRAVAEPLEHADLDAARGAVSHVVGRDTGALDSAAVASAAIETLTENASDSVVAPWLWYVVGGLPAAAAFRAINTLDAMVGYRSQGRFGSPSARLDDIANFVPARATALAVAVAGAAPCRTLRGTWQDAGATPSPNSGWPMAAAAFQLGVRLEKRGYHVLNSAGREPNANDIRRALHLTARALVLAAVAALAGSAIAGGRR